MIEIYKKKENNELKYFFYVDKSKKVKIKNIETGDVLDYSKKYENVVGGLYTQADIVGIDIQLGKTSAIVIFKENTTFTKTVQGMGRMRKLTTTQDIHFICNESIIKKQKEKNLSLIEEGKINHINLINFFKDNDDKEKKSNRIYMYKQALFDLLGKKIIKLNIFEEPKFYDDLNNGKKYIKYLIDKINDIDSSNSTQQEQSQSESQSQSQGESKGESKDKKIKVRNKLEKKIIYKYSIFNIIIDNKFDLFYDSKSFNIYKDEKTIINSKILLDIMRSLQKQNIFISPMVYLPHYFNLGKTGDITYYILEYNNNYIIISLKEYLDLKTVENQLDLELNTAYLNSEIDTKKFLSKFKKYKLIDKIDKNELFNVSMIMNFITRYNMPMCCFYLRNYPLIKFYNYRQTEKIIINLSYNNFLEESEIKTFITKGEREIKSILVNPKISEHIKTEIRELFKIERRVRNKYLINYKNKYLKYKKKYMKLKLKNIYTNS